MAVPERKEQENTSMNKTAKRIISFFCMMSVLSTTTYALELNYYGENTVLFNEPSSQLHFTGSADSGLSNRMATIFVMMPGKTLADVNSFENVAYMKSVSVDFDGGFEFEFGFDELSGEYPIYVLCDDEQFNTTYNFKSQGDIAGLFDLIRKETVTYSDIEEYSQTLGLDLSFATKEGYKTTVIKRITEKKNSITDSNESVNLIKEILKNCISEFAKLEEVKNAVNWSKLPSVLEEITSLTGVSYDYKGKSKQSVCTKLIGKEFTSAEQLQEKFNEAVKEAGNNDGGSGSGGGGGKTTGGGSYGNVSSMVNNQPQAVTGTDSSNAFTDISNISWAIKPINYLYSKGIVNGTGDGKFSPDSLLKREEIAKIIVSAFNLTSDEATTTFTDTLPTDWHYKYIASAQEREIVNGMSDTLFGVGKYVTRQDIAVMIYNAAIIAGKGFTSSKTDFTDFEAVSDYAKTAVSALAGEGVINGMDDGSFAPKQNATRAQAAKMIYEVIQ